MYEIQIGNKFRDFEILYPLFPVEMAIVETGW